jgi:multisubunit Na+/H+ antiporter MnhC subunit
MSDVFTATAMALFLIGIYCVVTKRNMIKIVIGIEIMTAAVNLNFISMAWNGTTTDPLAASIVLISIAIGAAVAAYALSLIIRAFRSSGSVDARKLKRLRW